MKKGKQNNKKLMGASNMQISDALSLICMIMEDENFIAKMNAMTGAKRK